MKKFYEKSGYYAVESQGWLYRGYGREAGSFQDHGLPMVEYDPQTRRFIQEIQILHERENFGVLSY